MGPGLLNKDGSRGRRTAKEQIAGKGGQQGKDYHPLSSYNKSEMSQTKKSKTDAETNEAARVGDGGGSSRGITTQRSKLA